MRGLPSQRASDVESVCMSWRHHGNLQWLNMVVQRRRNTSHLSSAQNTGTAGHYRRWQEKFQILNGRVLQHSWALERNTVNNVTLSGFETWHLSQIWWHFTIWCHVRHKSGKERRQHHSDVIRAFITSWIKSRPELFYGLLRLTFKKSSQLRKTGLLLRRLYLWPVMFSLTKYQ